MNREIARKTTWLWRTLLFLAALYFIFFAGGCKTDEPAQQFSIRIISANQLPSLDPLRTYHYTFTQVDPDSLLRSLLQAGIPVNRAWLPLDNFCLDPVGPRFTVELLTADQRIESFHFDRGEGRLACASQFREYQRRN